MLADVDLDGLASIGLSFWALGADVAQPAVKKTNKKKLKLIAGMRAPKMCLALEIYLQGYTATNNKNTDLIRIKSDG